MKEPTAALEVHSNLCTQIKLDIKPMQELFLRVMPLTLDVKPMNTIISKTKTCNVRQNVIYQRLDQMPSFWSDVIKEP